MRDPAALVRRMQECFNSRRFDEADELHAADFVSHALGDAGFEAGKAAWRLLVAHFPDYRVVAEDVLVDGDRVAVRSTVEGIPVRDGVRPMLLEIFRVENGRFAEMWGLGQGLPLDVLG